MDRVNAGTPIRATLGCHTLTNELIEGSQVVLELAEGASQFEVPRDYVIPYEAAYMRLDIIQDDVIVDTRLQSVPLDKSELGKPAPQNMHE